MAKEPAVGIEIMAAEEEEEGIELEGAGEEEEEVEGWEDWRTDEEDSEPGCLCLFCDSRYDSSEALFDHCRADHSFDFQSIRKTLGLDFYGSFKLINYVRVQVSENRCWSCDVTLHGNKDLLNHLHVAFNFEKVGNFNWMDDKYLKPFMQEDALLHSFACDEEGEEDYTEKVDKDELIRELMDTKDLAEIFIDDENILDSPLSESGDLNEDGGKEASAAEESANTTSHFQKIITNGMAAKEAAGASHTKGKNKQLKVSFANVAAREIKNVNENYFGAYGSFGIHREMINDKVRMDAYRGTIMNNPSLMNQATVLDVGCGTGILSLFAAQAGASRVIAVEASEKMAAVATQILKDNGFILEGNRNGDSKHNSGVINVVQSMVEELDKIIQVPPHSIDVLVSEWMGYCLLYESMLSSVLYARDHWLKPGGAILPDTATIFVAGFGRGGTSIPFWESVYGFDMSCIGKELLEDAAKVPIVDVMDSHNIVTEAVVLQSFDLVTMKLDEMDFTAGFELEPKIDLPGNHTNSKSGTTLCYGIVLWFETGFTNRFCKEMPTVLSTSPYSLDTHWMQTIFTFSEPIAMATVKPISDAAAAVGTEGCPVTKISSRISIARAAVHRSIDISLETTGISFDGRKHDWPVQMFNL